VCEDRDYGRRHARAIRGANAITGIDIAIVGLVLEVLEAVGPFRFR